MNSKLRIPLCWKVWFRAVIALFASISVAGVGAAWGSLEKSSELQLRLVRASELNAHLKEMNLAAAGLAHETRNPLNIIRGLAQIISRQPDVSPEITRKSREIIDESDRLSAQLNEFINYSRPREVHFAPVELGSLVKDIARTLSFDMEEKKIQFSGFKEDVWISADEQLLRQALFNLLLNATQAVPEGGEVQVRILPGKGNEIDLEIADTGHGVPPGNRTEIFKPYFTTNEKGTGLGLAVVQQIILGHGWTIECLGNEPVGAIFRICHIKIANDKNHATAFTK